ncbi:MAG: biopolymer transporter ExbD [Opitutaceae bacterium]|nr:biopolymer transporter ExbD [Opitutaceae bacterium]
MSRINRYELSGDDNADVGFQIAPMIDVVFVVLVFFMSLTSAIKVEAELNTKLPGNATTSAKVEFPDEQMITIETDGTVLLNDDPLDPKDSRELRKLTDAMMRLKENATAAQTLLLVTITSAPKAPYYRTIDVLNAMAVAGVENVTFSVEDGF